MLVRLQKIIADRGYCSRRHAEELIVGGQVFVDGIKVDHLGAKYEEDTVAVKVGSTLLSPKPASVGYNYFLVNKPCGFITSAKDDRGRKTVTILIPERYGRLFPVGRLDINTTGALIMTDDGDFANLVTHPSSSFDKTYLVVIDGVLRSSEQKELENGVMLEDGRTAPAQIKIVSLNMDESAYEITIHEGKNREVRRMIEAVGHNTVSLTRTRLGPLKLGDMKTGEYRPIPLEVVEEIKKTCLYNREHNTYKKADHLE